jgi:hypothetical protein
MADLENFTKGQLERIYAIQIAPLLKEVSGLKEEIKELKAMIENNKSIYTIDELTKLFKVSRQTIANWRNEKKLIPHKINGRVYFKREDIEKLINYSKIEKPI